MSGLAAREVSARRVSRPGYRSWLLRIALAAGVLLALSVAASPAPMAGDSPSLECQVKAAFIYNFAKFVEWPDDAGSAGGAPLTLGVLGEDSLADALDGMVRGKKVGDRILQVRKFKSLESLEPCQVLFIAPSEEARLPKILARIRQAPILTVGEGRRFGQEGGMVRFLMEDHKLHFEIRIDLAERAGLKISSKLLALAKVIRDAEEEAH
jgi:hypothetical protein